MTRVSIVDAAVLPRNMVVAAIASLETELFGRGAWSEAAVRQELEAPARTYVLALTDQQTAEMPCDSLTFCDDRCDDLSQQTPRVCGYAGFWYDGDDAEVMTVGVARHWQRHGIAAALMRRLLAAAREQGARRMLLEVRVDNEAALALYRRFGFTRIGVRKRYYQPDNVDAYVMAVDMQPRVIGFTAKEDQQ